MLLKILIWVVVVVLGFLWWKRRSGNKRKDRTRR
jgi:hypothetical protein